MPEKTRYLDTRRGFIRKAGTVAASGVVLQSGDDGGLFDWDFGFFGPDQRVLDQDGAVVAEDPTDWKFSGALSATETDDGVEIELGAGADGPAVDYVQPSAPSPGGTGELWAETTGSGEVRRRFDAGSPAYGIAVTEHTVFVYRDDDTVAAIDRSSGVQRWSHSHHSASVNAIATDGERVYTGDFDGVVVAADASDGSELWSNSDAYRVRSMAASEGVVYYAEGEGSLSDVYAVNSSDGSSLWSTEEDNDVNDLAADPGAVYIANYDGYVRRRSAADGSEEWTHTHNESSVSSVVVSDGLVFSGGTLVVAADASDGSEAWSNSYHDDGYDNFLAPSHSRVVIRSSQDTGVIAADVADGSLAWEIETSSTTSALGTHENRLYTDFGGSTIAEIRNRSEFDLYVSDGDTWLPRA